MRTSSGRRHRPASLLTRAPASQAVHERDLIKCWWGAYRLVSRTQYVQRSSYPSQRPWCHRLRLFCLDHGFFGLADSRGVYRIPIPTSPEGKDVVDPQNKKVAKELNKALENYLHDPNFTWNVPELNYVVAVGVITIVYELVQVFIRLTSPSKALISTDIVGSAVLFVLWVGE